MPFRRNSLIAWTAVAVAVPLILAGGFYGEKTKERHELEARAAALTGGDIVRGRQAFAHYGCGGCHSVGGVPGASGKVGPPLDGVGSRAILGGHLENKPDNMMKWIVDPQAYSPGTAMPNLGVTAGDAQDIAAFLYTKT
jgi:cytochrome c